MVFVLENALYLTMSQGMLYLKDPAVHSRDKQLLKRELGTEMVRQQWHCIGLLSDIQVIVRISDLGLLFSDLYTKS